MTTATKTKQTKTPYTDALTSLLANNAAIKNRDYSAKTEKPTTKLLIKAAIEGSTLAEKMLVEEIGRGKEGWAIVSPMASGNKRTVCGRYNNLRAAHAARNGSLQIVVAADNIAIDDRWVWGDIRHLVVSSEGWTSVVPA